MRLPGGALGGLAGEDVGVEAGIVRLDQEAQDLTLFGSGPDHGHVREGGVADPLFLPVEHVTAVSLHRLRAKRPGIAPRLRFREAETPDLLAPGHRRQPLMLLLLGPKLVYGGHREPTLNVQESGQAPRPARELRDRKPVRNIIPPGTPVLPREGP